jgi:hypothetical protein
MPSGECVPRQCVQTLDPRWHSARRNAIDFGNFSSRFGQLCTIKKVSLVGSLISLGKFGVDRQASLKFGHYTGSFKS